jgi:hypothetical protein
MNKISRILLLILLALLGALSVYAATNDPYAETFSKVLKDGYPVFDADDLPGHDSSENNGLVRNFDKILYRIETSLNNASDSNVYVEATLNDKAEWVSLPEVCSKDSQYRPTSELIDSNGDGLKDKLVCNFGDLEEGTKIIIEPEAIAVGNNKDKVLMESCAHSDNNTNNGGLSSGSCSKTETEISAKFLLNLNETVSSFSDSEKIKYVPAFSYAKYSGQAEDGRVIN